MRLTAFLTLLPLLVSISIVNCKQVQALVAAVNTKGHRITKTAGETPSFISDSFRSILPALEVNAHWYSTRAIYQGFNQMAKDYVYVQVIIWNEDKVPAGAPCRSGDDPCFGFISTKGHVGLFRLLQPGFFQHLQEPEHHHPIASLSPLLLVAHREHVETEVTAESAAEWASIAKRMYKEFELFDNAFKKAYGNVDSNWGAEATNRMPELQEQSRYYHTVIAEKQKQEELQMKQAVEKMREQYPEGRNGRKRIGRRYLPFRCHRSHRSNDASNQDSIIS
ncbi:hypothetical protein BDP27DRAFT_296300 [Rhodocollybia butyracea]|uniref:Uncharacterized protein n=1 Tax=Rhodocollybia butyracea TaxID=206335 RepID=A0A9P5PGF2_9AGAR|nr:hypothetical protein BDP27DRAFT_296300 [Rhodocollybia butyracea]